MAVKKKKKVKKIKKTKKKTKPTKTKSGTKKKEIIKDPNILDIVEREIEINCPVRGKIKKKFKVKIIKPVSVDDKQYIGSNDYVDKIDDSTIYGTTDESDS
jgi:hypothetical protein